MPSTVIKTTFPVPPNTIGASITGYVPETTTLGGTAFTDFAPAFGTSVFATGGGAKASSFGTGGTQAFNAIDLGATSQDTTILWSFTAAVGTQPDPQVQWHRDGTGANELGVTISFSGGVLIFGKTVAGTPTEFGRPAVTLVAGHSYTLSVANSGAAATIDLIDNTASTTQHVFTSQAVPTGTGNMVLFGQASATAGDLLWTGLEVDVAGSGSAPTAGTATAGSTTSTTASASIATNTGGTSPYSNQLQVSPHTAGTWVNNGSPVAGATASLTATGLTASTAYDLRVVVTDSAGATSTSNAVTETTSAASTVSGVTVSPATATVDGGATQAFTATVAGTGSPSQSVTWAASAGSFSGATLTAPASTGSPQTVTVTATSVQDGSKSGTATVTVPASTATSVTVSPSTATVSGGATRQFTATVAGTHNPSQAVTWGTSAGTISTGGLLTAPAVTGSAQSVTVTATSVRDGTKSGTAAVTVPATSTSGGGQLSVYYPTPSLSTIYFAVTEAGGKAWNGSAFEALASADWGTYAVAGSDPGGVGIYLADMPSGVPPGLVTVYAFLRAGGSPARSDALVGVQPDALWDGTTLGGSASGGSGGGVTLSELNATLAPLLPATSRGGSSTTFQLQAGTGVDVVGQCIQVLSGPAIGQARFVTLVDATTAVCTVDRPWSGTAPTAPCQYMILASQAVPDPMAAMGAILAGETGYQSLRKILAEATGEWDVTSVPGQVVYRLGGAEMFRAPVPASTGRAQVTNGGGL